MLEVIEFHPEAAAMGFFPGTAYNIRVIQSYHFSPNDDVTRVSNDAGHWYNISMFIEHGISFKITPNN